MNFYDDEDYDNFIDNIVPTMPKTISNKELENYYDKYYRDICIKKYGEPSKKATHGFDIDNRYDLASLLHFSGIEIRDPIPVKDSYNTTGFKRISEVEHNISEKND
jgi:hypothetical protein